MRDVFKDLFILDMANNHQGDFKHAKNIINNFDKVIKEEKINGVIKLQFRNLETYIHKKFLNSQDKYVKRFSSTKLENSDYKKLISIMKRKKLKTISTPFDEDSIKLIERLEIDFIKIASVSANDKNLIKESEKLKKPIIISVGGKNIEEIDWVVNYLEMKNSKFAIQHCVAVYPTKDEDLELNQIDFLKNRYANIPIGFSTHENPDNYSAIQIATSKGSQMFERHIGLITSKYNLNEYSSTPIQIKKWIKSFKKAKLMLGSSLRKPASKNEIATLNKLSRGVYAKSKIKERTSLNLNDVYFAFPLINKQISSSEFTNSSFTTSKIIKKDGPINFNNTKSSEELDENTLITNFMLQFKSMIKLSKCAINDDAKIELSHHYGLNKFREFGCLIITCFNYNYAKKILIQLPRQKHPYHMHKRKTETFQILYGSMETEVDGEKISLKSGDYCNVKAGLWHKFHTSNGVIFEEVSTKHYNNDSIYKDKKINDIDRKKRKTKLDHWIKYFKSVS